MLEAIFLGLIQGLTEFLPISSSAHLRITGLLHEKAADPGATFTAIIQIGTELAVILYFRKQIWQIVKNWFRSIRKLDCDKAAAKLGWLIILGSIPIVGFGYFLQDLIRNELRSLWLVATVLIIGGLIIGAADKFGKRYRNLNLIQARDGWIAGFAQALALIPGVSRSGATISAMRLLGFNRVAALEYSFLLAIPAVLASGFFELANSIANPELSRFSGSQTAIATLISFTVGYAAVAWLIKFVARFSFLPFVIYRVLLGATLLALLSTGAISA